MTIKTAALAAALALSVTGGAAAQTPYGSNQTQSRDPLGEILGALIGSEQSVDAQWSRGRRPLDTGRTQFNGRVDTAVRGGTLSSASAQRLRADYDALVQLEARYGSDGRFTTAERTELGDRYGALTQALEDGRYGEGSNPGSGSSAAYVADGRADFDARVDAAVRARRVTRTEATRLKTDYQALIQVEAGYLRDGSLSSRERDDLDSRLDALDARVGDGPSTGTPAPLDPRARLSAIEAALPSLTRTEAAEVRAQLGDLTRLEAAYSRSSPSSDDRAYLDRRLGELEVRARVRR